MKWHEKYLGWFEFFRIFWMLLAKGRSILIVVNSQPWLCAILLRGYPLEVLGWTLGINFHSNGQSSKWSTQIFACFWVQYIIYLSASQAAIAIATETIQRDRCHNPSLSEEHERPLWSLRQALKLKERLRRSCLCSIWIYLICFCLHSCLDSAWEICLSINIPDVVVLSMDQLDIPKLLWDTSCCWSNPRVSWHHVHHKFERSLAKSNEAQPDHSNP